MKKRITLTESDFINISNNVIKRLHEAFDNDFDEDFDDETSQFEQYKSGYEDDPTFNPNDITRDDLIDFCENSGDFLYITSTKWFGTRMSAANSEEIQSSIVNDLINGCRVELSHEIDWYIERYFDNYFKNDKIAIFKLSNIPNDDDYFVIYEER